MASRAIKAFFVGGALCAAALILWPGCATPPLPSSRKPIALRKTADFKFLKSGKASRDEMTAKLGAPDAYFDDLHVACYRVNEVTKRNLYLCLFVIPVYVERNPGALDIALIEFDDHNYARRLSIRTGFFGNTNSTEGLLEAARDWLAAAHPKQSVPKGSR
jgi:hypothetical protein